MRYNNTRYEIPVKDIEKCAGEIIIVKDIEESICYFAKITKNSGDNESGNLEKNVQSEVDILNNCHNDGIASVRDIILRSPYRIIIYQCTNAVLLWDYINREKTISVRYALQMIITLLDTIEYLHNKGILFCGFDPKRLLLSGEKIVLVDFAWACLNDGIHANESVGFFPYLSPEQTGFTGFYPDKRSDTFCIGMLLYTLLSGKSPFGDCNSLQKLLDEMLKKPVIAIDSVSVSINKILLKALRAAPDDRYQTTKGFKYDLQSCLSQIDNESFILQNIGHQDQIYSVLQTEVFVGRDKELEVLKKIVSNFRNGQGCSVVLQGPVGIGKTAVVNELHKYEIKELNYICVKCNNCSQNNSYYVLRNIFRKVIENVVKKSDKQYLSKLKSKLGQCYQHDIDALIGLIPEADMLFTQCDNVNRMRDKSENVQIVKIAISFMQLICEELPLVIVVDDMHWIDIATLNVIQEIIISKCNCLIIMTKNDFVDTVRLNFLRNVDVLIDLDPLSLTDIMGYVQRCFKTVTLSEKISKLLFENIDGSPLMLKEFIRHLIHLQAITPSSQGWDFNCNKIEKSFDFKSIVLDKKKKFDIKLQHFFEIAVIIGASLQSEILKYLVNCTDKILIGYCELLDECGFVYKHTESKELFILDKVSEIVINFVEPDKKIQLISEIANRLENISQDKPEYLALSADYFLQSGNVEKSYYFNCKAAEYAFINDANETAEYYYSNAITQLNSSELLALKNDILTVFKSYADVLLQRGKHDKALYYYNYILCNIALNKKQNIEILYAIGLIYHNMGNFENCIEYFSRILNVAGIKIDQENKNFNGMLFYEFLSMIKKNIERVIFKKQKQIDKIIISILNRLTYLYYLKNSRLPVLINLKALNYSSGVFDCAEKFYIMADHALIAHHIGFKKYSQKKMIELRTTANKKNGTTIAYIQTIEGIILYSEAQWGASEFALSNALDAYRNNGDVWGQLTPLKHLTFIAYYKGEINKALDYSKIEWELAQKCGDMRGSIRVLVYLKFLKNVDNKSDWNTLNKRLVEFNDPMMHSMIYTTIAQIEFLKGNYQQAYDHIVKSMNIVRKEKLKQEYISNVYCVLCTILAHEKLSRLKGDKKIAITDHQLLLLIKSNTKKAIVIGRSFPSQYGAALRCQAWLFAFQGQISKARNAFFDSCSILKKFEMKLEEAQTAKEYGQFCAIYGNQFECKGAYINALELFQQCGASRLVNELLKTFNYAMPVEKTNINNLSVNTFRIEALYSLTNVKNESHTNEQLIYNALGILLNITGAQDGYAYLECISGYSKQFISCDFENKILNDKVCPVELYKLAADTRNVTIYTKTPDVEYESLLLIPLHGRTSFIGCILLASKIANGIYSQDSIKISEIIASHIGVRIENELLLSKYKRMTTNLKEQVDKQTVDIRNKNELLESYYLKVVDSQRVKDLLSNAIVHDIKNAIFSIAADTRNLVRYSTENRRMISKLNSIKQNCNSIFEMAVNMLDIARMEEGRLDIKKEKIIVDDIKNVYNKFANNSLFEEKNIMLQFLNENCGTNDYIAVDKYLLERLFQNIINNAAKYTPENGKVIVSTRLENQELIISFYNSGILIPETQRTMIFDKYTVGGDIRSVYSKGLGLYFCKLIMNTHGGRIWVDCKSDGNNFNLSFSRYCAS